MRYCNIIFSDVELTDAEVQKATQVSETHLRLLGLDTFPKNTEACLHITQCQTDDIHMTYVMIDDEFETEPVPFIVNTIVVKETEPVSFYRSETLFAEIVDLHQFSMDTYGAVMTPLPAVHRQWTTHVENLGFVQTLPLTCDPRFGDDYYAKIIKPNLDPTIH